MKSKEEIQQLAEHYWEGCDGCDANDKYFFIKGFGCAYRQLKEDILDDLAMHILINEHDWNRNPQAQLRDFIESLNKQD